MTITITAGWWLVPLAVTLAAFFASYVAEAENRTPAGDYGSIGAGLASLFHYGAAVIVSLVAWLIWSFLR